MYHLYLENVQLLHSRAFLVDGVTSFVGSLNFDPRSRSLNTEMGILFEGPVLVSELQKIIFSTDSNAFIISFIF